MKLDKFIEKYGNIKVNEEELKDLLGIKDEKYFIPKEDEWYFVVGMSGNVFENYNNSDFDKEICENEEVFRTKEEAEEHAKKQRFLLKMKRDFLDNSNDIDWKDDVQKKYYISYDHFNEKIRVYSDWSQQYAGFYTTNAHWLHLYIQGNYEEIKKYYFEVEEKEEEL